MTDSFISFDVSLATLERAKHCIPSQTQTFSKGWTQFPLGVSPVFAARAQGGHIWDVDGNEFIDWPMGIGPLLLGHNHPAVNEAVRRQLDRGICFSLPNVGEVELAERLIRWFPYAERVRFGKNGSDATAGSVRAARAYTGRDVILCCGYHGWQDWYIGTTTRNAGVPEACRKLVFPFPYDDLPALKRILAEHEGRVAAVIMEPMGVIEPEEGYLKAVRSHVHQAGALLIFDECWTGFRLHLQGAYGKFGVAPDMACFGKALGNGVPISAVVGRADVMDIFDEIFFSFTFGGDMLGIAAAHAVLSVLETEPVLEKTAEVGTALREGVKDLIRDHGLEECVRIDGYPQKTFMAFSGDGADGLLIKSLYQQEAISRGILAAGYHAPCLAHTLEDVQRTLDAYDAAFASMSEGLHRGDLHGRLKGEPVRPVFRKH